MDKLVLPTGYTPGPWRAEGPDEFGDINILPANAMAAIGVAVSNLWAPEEVAANAQMFRLAPAMASEILALREERDRLLEALAVPSVWTEEERDGMLRVFTDRSAKHGLSETLFAVAGWLLRHRAALTSTGETT